MIKVKYFRIEELTERTNILFPGCYEIIRRDGDFEFWSDDDRVAFEEKIEIAFRQCIGSGFEVCAVGLKRNQR